LEKDSSPKISQSS